jgi:trans-aconitate methyltransferase
MKLASRILRRLGFKSIAWDEEFKSDHWDRGTTTDPIYMVLKMFPGSMLEFGCGTGMTPYESNRADYTGIDISSMAIAKARARNPHHEFEVAAMEDYVPTRKYDVVLFRESIYYVKRVSALLTRLEPFLEDQGVFIARICSRSRHWDVIAEITRNRKIIETVLLDAGGIILVFQ